MTALSLLKKERGVNKNQLHMDKIEDKAEVSDSAFADSFLLWKQSLALTFLTIAPVLGFVFRLFLTP